MVFDIDKISSFVYKSIDILLLKNPEKTAYGILLGTIFISVKYSLLEIVAENMIKALQRFNDLAIFALGIVIVRIDIIFKKEPIDNEVVARLNSLKLIIDQGNFSDREKRQLYRNLISSIYDKIEVSSKSNDDIKAV